jgi:hypothetical protein
MKKIPPPNFFLKKVPLTVLWIKIKTTTVCEKLHKEFFQVSFKTFLDDLSIKDKADKIDSKNANLGPGKRKNNLSKIFLTIYNICLKFYLLFNLCYVHLYTCGTVIEYTYNDLEHSSLVDDLYAYCSTCYLFYDFYQGFNVIEYTTIGAFQPGKPASVHTVLLFYFMLCTQVSMRSSTQQPLKQSSLAADLNA